MNIQKSLKCDSICEVHYFMINEKNDSDSELKLQDTVSSNKKSTLHYVDKIISKIPLKYLVIAISILIICIGISILMISYGLIFDPHILTNIKRIIELFKC